MSHFNYTVSSRLARVALNNQNSHHIHFNLAGAELLKSKTVMRSTLGLVL